MEKCCSRYFKTLFQMLSNIHNLMEKLPLQPLENVIKLLWKSGILKLACLKNNKKIFLPHKWIFFKRKNKK